MVLCGALGLPFEPLKPRFDLGQDVTDSRQVIVRLRQPPQRVVTFALIRAEACRILEEGIAARPADIDVIWANGYGFPRQLGGPMHWAERLGWRRIADGLAAWHQRTGDDVFRPNTWHSIELNATVKVPEWGGQEVRFALEEDAAPLEGGKWDWIDGRQEQFYLIQPSSGTSARQ